MTNIKFLSDDNEVIRIDVKGFYYRGQFIADAGEAHHLLVEFLRKHQPEGNWQHADAEPEPERPTREQAVAVYSEVMATHECQTLGEMAEHFTHAVLARWGNHPGSPDSSTPQPVSVSERLPRPEDCDAEGRCWWYGDGEDMVGWTFQDLEGLSYYKATYWLPAHALPVPSHD